MEIFIALGLIVLVALNAPVDTKPPQEIKSVSTSIGDKSTSIEDKQAVQPKAKPTKKKAVKKVAKADPNKQQLNKEAVKVDSNKQPATKEVAKKETAKTEPVKEPPATVSSPAQKSNQYNLLYYILGFLTLGATAAYFYFRTKSKATEAKIYTSDELKKSLEQDTDEFKSQTSEPKTNIEPQQSSSSDQPPSDPKPIIEPQQSSSDQPASDPKPEDETKKT
jgi:outer membrane biosynthesis protein TonB